jgi:hypothetical protein
MKHPDDRSGGVTDLTEEQLKRRGHVTSNRSGSIVESKHPRPHPIRWPPGITLGIVNGRLRFVKAD